MSMSIKKDKNRQNSSRKTTQNNKIRATIKRDSVSPRDYLKYKLPWACEDCVHFTLEKNQCSLGYRVEAHMRENLERMYEISGTMTLCRFLEID